MIDLVGSARVTWLNEWLVPPLRDLPRLRWRGLIGADSAPVLVRVETNIEARPGKRTKLDRLELDAVRAQADDLRAELADFDLLRGGALSTFDVATLEELSTVLVKARIARGWTQRQLAEALGMAEQQIQRYEANDYRSTSLARLCDIANALGVTVAQHAELNPSAA